MAIAAELLLWINAPHFCAGAVWQRRGGAWECVHAAPIIRWMVGKPADEVRAALVRTGWRYEWIRQGKAE